MTGRAIASLCRLVCGTSVQWHCDPYGTTQRIYFSNHSSHLDFIVIWSALPSLLRQRIRPVAAREYWERNAIRRHLATDVFNAVLIERGSDGPKARAAVSHPSCAVDAARATTSFIAAEIGSAYSLILFPEGTRCASGSVGPFKSGLYFLSQARPDIELIPVCLENLNRILPKGEALPVPMLSRVIFGAPLPMTMSEDKTPFLERARAAVMQLGAHLGSKC
ncbi:MAG TPA: lysophospholipid acyltransferase family protein [Vicinamibacterales bacterium]|jgi:1-acyl-sn-glycerol-3-phosphate acyltransferase